MNILYCGDKPMQKGILLSSMSLIKNVDEPLNIYILTVDYREKGINYKPVDKAFAKYLEEKLNKSDIKVNIFLVDVTRYFVEELPEANMQSRFTACCMLRLFADKTDIKDRVLYLDTDVLCRKGFRDFYHQNMDGIEIAGVSDYYGRWLFGDGYINSGVMLMNMRMIRQNGLLEKCREQCIRRKCLCLTRRLLIHLQQELICADESLMTRGGCMTTLFFSILQLPSGCFR